MFGIGKKGKVKKAVKSALADDVLTDDEVRELEQLAEQTGVSAEYINDVRSKHFEKVSERIMERVYSTRRFSPDDEAELLAAAEKLKITLSINDNNLTKCRKLWEIENTGTFTPEPIDVHIRLGRGEECYYSTPAVWCQMKTIRQHHGYSGASVSFRVAKGVSLRFGKARPHYSERDALVDISDGTLFMTNKKLVFEGVSRSTSITFGRIISHEIYTDGVEVRKSSGKPDVFKLSPVDVEFVDALFQVL